MNVDKLIIKECNIFGKNFSFSKKINTSMIYDVLKAYGANSEQFYFLIQGFILWCMIRYKKYQLEDDEDIFNQCVASVIYAMKDFDETKGKLENYLHAIVRNEISKFNYRNMVNDNRYVSIDLIDNMSITYNFEDRIYDWINDFKS